MEKLLDHIRAKGWMVASHNDYRLNGKFHTFWAFVTPDGRFIKGEGESDYAALLNALDAEPEPASGGGEPLTFTYRNHRGEIGRRTVTEPRIHFGSTSYYPSPQWLLTAMDINKQAGRTFAVSSILSFGDPGTGVPADVEARPSASGGYAELVEALYDGDLELNYEGRRQAAAAITALSADLDRALSSENYLKQSAEAYAKLAATREGELDDFRRKYAVLSAERDSLKEAWEIEKAEFGKLASALDSRDKEIGRLRGLVVDLVNVIQLDCDVLYNPSYPRPTEVVRRARSAIKES